VVLQLDADSIAPIFQQVMSAGLSRAILHVQIERGGERQLSAYDNFHPECVVVGSAISESLLSELKTNRILHAFSISQTE